MSAIQWHDLVEDLPEVDERGETIGWVQSRKIGGIATVRDGSRQVRFVEVPLDANEQAVGMAKALIAQGLEPLLNGGSDRLTHA